MTAKEIRIAFIIIFIIAAGFLYEICKMSVDIITVSEKGNQEK